MIQNRFCPNCGAALAPDARFCENCGKPVAAQPAAPVPPAYSAPPPPPVYSAPPPPPAYSAPPPPYSAPPPPAAPRSKKGLVIGLVIAGLLALLCCGVAGIYWAYQNFQGAIAAPQSIQATITQIAIEMPKTLPPATLAPPATAESLPATAAPQQDTPAPPPSGPTTAPKPPDDQRTRYDYQGIAFSYDPGLAAAVEPETVEAETGMFSIPQHRRLVFIDYPLDANHQAQILVFPVQEYQQIDPDFGGRFANLQQMLMSRSTSNLPQPLPFFPSWNAGQIIAAQVKYLDFQNGSGVRYLTQYGQDVYPINNQALFYTFQGITSDRQWLVSAILPVSNSVLPDPEVLIQTPGFFDNFSAYLETAKDLLDGLPDSSYQPDLALLDAIFQSLAVK